MADGSPFSLKKRWLLVWETELPAQNFSPFVQKAIKAVLSMIIVVRCATTYAYVMSAILVIYCIIRGSAPKLMLLWLLVAGVKSVCMTFLEALTGVYVCSAFGKIRKACIEFFISKALEIIFASYLWGSVQNIYQDMATKAETKRVLHTKEQMFIQRMDFCRQRARSLVDESTLYKTACLNNFEFKDVPQIILQMLRADNEMSQDSLLGPGMMLASVSNLGSFDHLKTSQSLGELGFVDLRNTQVVGLEEDETLSNKEKALRFLKLTHSDVIRIKMNKTSVENDIYTIDRDMWKQVEASGKHIYKPKQSRTKVFIREIPQTDPCEENSARAKMWKRSFEHKFGFSFSNLINEKQSQFDEEQDDEFIFSQDEDEDDDEPSPLFMSNLKEGVIIHPHRLGVVIKKKKGNAYAKLYRQDFMNVVGPEVFDKASKLPKITSLTKLSPVFEAKHSVSLPAIPQPMDGNPLLETDSKEKISQTSSEELQQSNEEDFDDAESSLGEKIEWNQETESKEEEHTDSLIYNIKEEEPTELEFMETQDTYSDNSERSKTTNRDSTSSLYITSSDHSQEATPGLCFRKRRIIIKRIGKKKKSRKWLWSSSSLVKKNSKNHEAPDVFKETHDDVKFTETRKESEKPSPNSNSEKYLTRNSQTYAGGYNQHVYFLTKILQKPLLEFLINYYDLKRKTQLEEQLYDSYKNQNCNFFNIPLRNYYLRKNERISQSFDFNPIQGKVWKSQVLKTVEARTREGSAVTLRNVLSIIKRESVLRRLLKYEYARLTNKNEVSLGSNNDVFILRVNGCERYNFNGVKNEVVCSSNNNITSNQGSKISLKTEMNEPEENDLENSPKITSTEFIREKAAAEKESDDKKPVTESTHEQEIIQDGKVLVGDPDEESICSQESDEPISLYYSKAANLASPLFDMKRFIYPDHIHYSYKHVKKKGFDVDINGGLPLLMRESLTMSTPVKLGSKPTSKNPEYEITRRPMDLSFASTNAFAEWQNNDQNDLDVTPEKHVQKFNNSCGNKERNSSIVDLIKNKKTKKAKRSKKNNDRTENHSSSKIDFNKSKPKPNDGSFNNIKYLYSTKDYALIEKLLKMHMQFNSKFQTTGKERKPIQISSTQLHSNKGRVNSTYNPAIFLQENKTRSEKKKIETQEERTKDMFARLEREALLHSKNMQKSNRSP